MWHHPHGNYPVSYSAADGLPNAFSYFGQTFVRRPDPIIVRKSPESPKSEAGSDGTTPNPPSDKPNPNPAPTPILAQQSWPSYANPLTAMNMNAFSMFHSQPHQPPAPPKPVHPSHYQQKVPPPAEGSVLKQPQYYTQPHPSMWPTIPSGHDAYALPQPSFLGATATTLGAEKPPTHPQPLAPDAHKYKCTICGRYRSARYHYKHPLLPGYLPKKTICRKCRENATDSGDASTDSYEAKQDIRSRSRSLRRTEAAALRRKQSRSQSRGRRRSARVSFQTNTSSSDSSDAGTVNHKKHRQPMSIYAPEVTRHVNFEPERQIPQHVRTIYVQEAPHRPVVAPPHNEVLSADDTRARYVPRPPTPYHHDYFEPQSRQQCRLRTEYFDGPVLERDNRGVWIDATTASRLPRTMDPQNRKQTNLHVREHQPGVNGERLRRPYGNGRDRYQHAEHEDGIKSSTGADQAWIPRAPSPPWRRGFQAPPRTRYAQQMNHLPRDDSPECGDDEVIVIETNEPETKEDYDWYDDNGMRVRVREI